MMLIIVALSIKLSLTLGVRTLQKERTEIIISLVMGSIYGLGLILTGGCKRQFLLQMLRFEKFEFTPIGIFCIAIFIKSLLSFLAFHLMKKPVYAEKFAVKKSVNFEKLKIFGAICSGIGIGMSGLTPGTSLVNAIIQPHMLPFLPMLACGQIICDGFIAFKTVYLKNKQKEE